MGDPRWTGSIRKTEPDIEVMVRTEAKLDYLMKELLGREGDPGRIPKIEHELENCKKFRQLVSGAGTLLAVLFGGHEFKIW